MVGQPYRPNPLYGPANGMSATTAALRTARQPQQKPVGDLINEITGLLGNNIDQLRGAHEAKGGAISFSGIPGSEADQQMYAGPLPSAIPGRTDRIRLDVKPGSYVVPADVVSILGEGNTHAGSAVLKMMFPHHAMPHGHAGKGVRAPHLGRRRKDGGSAPQGGNVPIVAAGGEEVLAPEQIVDKFGDLDHGHRSLDAWIKAVRAKEISRLATCPPPKR